VSFSCPGRPPHDHLVLSTNLQQLYINFQLANTSAANGTFEVLSIKPMIVEVKCRADSKRKLNLFFSPPLPRVATAVKIEWRGSCQSEGATFFSQSKV
jgi:hypothetical protein